MNADSGQPGPKRAFSFPASPRQIDDDVDAELGFHIEERIAQFVAEGMSREQAEQEVARRFGDYEAHRARTRAIDAHTVQQRSRAGRWNDLRREVALAVRSLRRTPGFTVIALFTLSLGLAATTGISSVLDAVVLRPLAYPQAERLVSVLHPATVPGSGERVWGVSPGGYFQFAEQRETFSAFGIYRSGYTTVTNDGAAEQAQTGVITASVFAVLQAQPFSGRLITEADDAPGAPPVVVLSREFHLRRFGGDPAVIGRNLETSSGPMEIVGVAEPGLSLPMPGPFASTSNLSGFGVDVWTPMQLDPAGPFYNNHPNVGVGRLRDGVSLAEAQRDLDATFARFSELMPRAYSPGFLDQYNFRVRVESLQETVLGPQLPRTLWMLFGAVLLVLAIATANVANLFLVRLEVRRRESAVRVALGADRWQMAAHYLSESLLLCVSAAGLAIALAGIGLRVLQQFAPTDIPRLAQVTLDYRAGLLALAVGTVLGVILGLVPLIRRRMDLDALRAGGRGQSASPRQRVIRNALVVGQLSMALVLLVAAGLMLRSFAELRQVEPGFRTANVLTFDTSLPYTEYASRAKAIQFHQELHRRLVSIPGVLHVGTIGSVPLEGFGTGCTVVWRENRPFGPDEQTPCVSTPTAGPGLFDALDVSVSGRTSEWRDVDARTQAVVVTQALADRLWPGESAIGKGIGSNGAESEQWYRVVGVAANLKAEALDAPDVEAVFYPLTGLDGTNQLGDVLDLSYMVRTRAADPLSVLPAVRQTLAALNARVPVIAPRTLDSVMARSMARTTFLMILLALAAGIALVLSAVGIYGVISYIVSQRRVEIGVRMALGASLVQVVRMVMLQSVQLAALGVLVGVAAALALSRLMQSQLFGVRATDPLVLTVVVVVVLATTLLASAIPARRAARVAPSEAMRGDG